MILYEAINTAIIKHLPNNHNPEHVLDVGCGTGQLGKYIKQQFNCQVTGVTYSDEEAVEASVHLDKVIVFNLNNLSLVELEKFDCVICSHILEHLYCPQNLLAHLHDVLLPSGKLIVALPNVLHWKQRLEFLKGNFKYTDGGLMDKTHFRFFDWDTAFDLVQNSGFQVIYREADGYFPLPLIRKIIGSSVLKIDRIATQIMPGLLGVQFIIVAKAT